MNYYEDYIPSESTYDIISKLSFLTGVSESIFTNEHEPPEREVFDILLKEKSCRIIRNLCLLRTQLVRNFKKIADSMRDGLYSISSLPKYVNADILCQLTADNIRFSQKAQRNINLHVLEINQQISNRLNNCKGWFPAWIRWEYIRSMFIAPSWFTEGGVISGAKAYYKNMSRLPYQVYINWEPIDEEGNLFWNDRRFVTRLYEANNDYFMDLAKVSDCGSLVKDNIHRFLFENRRTVMMVDCENSDPYRLTATLKGLGNTFLDKLEKIVLVNDVNTSSGWRILAEHIAPIRVEHTMTHRIKQDKSLVDAILISRACQEHYQNKVDSFVICSSDSDFWALVQSLPCASFLFLVERECFGEGLKTALSNSGIHYAYMEDFYEGNAQAIQTDALLREVSQTIEKALKLNLKDVLDKALERTRLSLTSGEQAKFFQQYMKTIRLVIDGNGDARLALNRK